MKINKQRLDPFGPATPFGLASDGRLQQYAARPPLARALSAVS
jgi:hypothetical protein